jgi:hypothetical protein
MGWLRRRWFGSTAFLVLGVLTAAAVPVSLVAVPASSASKS